MTMSKKPALAVVRYRVDLWVEVDPEDEVVTRVVVGSDGLADPVEVLGADGRPLSPTERVAILGMVDADTWPSWDYE